ncbi:CHAP domain-containing protein [Sediminicoccus rosea]|jgi:surface antigen|uniref:CHAP domain-containing protein n=1 Tax=Sediminicoccus rosea TaxID=1225128 RepID=A0ABZ0PCI1_9PROT|nr:CHAP domain-containing protein [Sediminicoccus rosea]WPB83400.1 CHAP domain-containing protein [Sediminicoccus rosea]
MRLKLATMTMCLLLGAAPFAPQASASRGDARSDVRTSASQPRNASTQANRQARPRQTRAGNYGGGLTCVPYARSVTGMDISGNGRDWWHNAAGRYARGQRPQVGSVLAWPGSGGMSSGHVAVVSRVINARLIEIDHANWGGPGIRRGTVMRNVQVMDVSSDNSWTRVRVQVGWSNENFGREYPTYGFIHNRPANTTLADAADEMIRPVSYSRRTAAPRSRATQQRPGQRPAQPATRVAQARPANR